ncbi:MAG: ADYC domain-containing protein, partial [Geminicoccaceae bacterium]
SGQGYTRNGTPIDVFDSLGIQKAANAQDMSFEAAFDVAGALCVARPRLHDGPTLDEIAARCPGRLAGRTGPACAGPDSPAAHGATMFVRSH